MSTRIASTGMRIEFRYYFDHYFCIVYRYVTFEYRVHSSATDWIYRIRLQLDLILFQNIRNGPKSLYKEFLRVDRRVAMNRRLGWTAQIVYYLIWDFTIILAIVINLFVL